MKENDKETEPEGEIHPLVTHGAPLDVDGKDVSDEDNDSTFGSEYNMAAQLNEIELNSDNEPVNTMGTNITHFPSLPSAPLTQVRGSTATTVNPRPLVPPSSTTTIPPTQTRSSAGSNIPHLLAPSSIFPETSTPTRSSTDTDISGPPPFVIVPSPPQAWQTAPLDPLPHLSPAAWGIWNPWHPWQMGSLSSEPTGPSPVYIPSAQLPCVVRNSQTTSFVFISSLSVHTGLRRETGL
jgi:hypothetical protein